MSGCGSNTAQEKKSCSGKCIKGACSSGLRVWVVAACEGMVSLFEKKNNGTIIAKSPVFPSLDQFQQSIEHAMHECAFDQIILVGSGNDIAWVHSSLPENVARHIAAEIKYPLLAGWFRETDPMSHLSQALTSVLSS